MTSGKTYTITYWARASKNRQLGVEVRGNAAPNTVYYTQNVNLTTSWQKYTTTFTPSASNSNVLLVFNAGQATGDVYLTVYQ